MPRKNRLEIDSKIQKKLDYIGLDLNRIPKQLQEYSDINFRTIKGFNEKKYKQYRFIDVRDIEILLSPTNRMESIKDKYEKAMPLCYYLDEDDEENMLNYTTFLKMLSKVKLSQIEEIEEEQKMLAKQIPFKVKFNGNYLWQIYYSEISDRYFMLVPTDDTNYSTFFYLLKKKIENKKNDKIFVPVSLVDYEQKILNSEEIKDLENYLWVFTKDYPLIYEVWDKYDEVSLNIIGEAEIYEKVKTLYKVTLKNRKEADKFYKLAKALFVLQTELPHYYEFSININSEGVLEFYHENSHLIYDIMPEFIVEQYLKSVSLKNKAEEDYEELNVKLKNLQIEADELEKEYIAKEKQITTFLECKKTFFGKVKYYFKFGKKSKDKDVKIRPRKRVREEVPKKEKKQKFNLQDRNYTLYELEESFKELEQKEEQNKNKVMDINALKLKNKNLKKKIENATNYIEEINKHKKSIFEFWKYSNKDAVATLDEGEEEEFNIKKLEKIFDFDDDFEKFGLEADKNQRKKMTDAELEACYVATTSILSLLNRMNKKVAENKEISEELKSLKILRENEDDEDYEEDEDEDINIFGRIKQTNNKERTLGNKTHRENPRDVFEILEIRKGTKGIELKRKLEAVLKDIKTALKKNTLTEDMYVYKVSQEKLELDTIEAVSLTPESELEEVLKNDRVRRKVYLYKIKLPKGTNFVAFSNIIFFDNKNMTLPTGMNLSTKILVDLSKVEVNEKTEKKLNKLQFEDEKNDFSKIIVKNIEVNELS